MAETALLSQIQNALASPSWDESIAGVKAAVADAVHRLDRHVELKDTQYFNHSFVPDFTLTWPGTQPRCRDLFLRLNANTGNLADDLRFLDSSRPILLELSSVVTGEQREALGPVSLEQDTMITDPVAIAELGSRGTTEFPHVLPAALLKGGRGVIGNEQAASLRRTATTFFAGSRTHRAPDVAAAASALSGFLAPQESQRLTEFARVVWEATGGTPTGFPLRTSLAGADDDALRFLLEEEPMGDTAFWRSIGHLVTIDRLVGLGIEAAPNLSSLVAANLDRIHARVMIVLAGRLELGAPKPLWGVSGGALAFHGSDFIAYFAAKRDTTTVTLDSAFPLGLDEFRLRMEGRPAESVTIATSDGKVVTIESERPMDVVRDPVITSLEERVGAGVRSVGLLLGGTSLECRFDDRSASGHTSAQFSLEELLQQALPVLWPVNDQDRDEVRSYLAARDEATRPLTLFDNLDYPGL